MKMVPDFDVRDEDKVEDADFKPLTAAEAQLWRQRNPPLSLWWVLLGQALVGSVVALAAWLLTGKAANGWSAAYGVLSVVVPAALFAQGVTGRLARTVPGAAMVGFFVWELVKIAVTVAMLFAAPRLVSGLNWLALLAGFVVTMKVVWVALLFRPKRQRTA
ncbi:ATP synthase protein I [Rhodoferax ferrireducens]|uniref:ATP synthase protein I n=2 Tax=Rhodoferax ferrireducens TaxID=192843 RepID=A0ABU2CEQ8_9BURK|nr:ATP synthase protein I [Rhodoferax ferrireducens]